MKGYDQWKTGSPYDDEYDPLEDAKKVLNSYRWAMMNWDTKPGVWEHHLKAMEKVIEELTTYISDQ
jgi:hypothetical protein